jgi:hypothetical protein
VSGQTVAKVRAAAAALGYRPNASARTLRTARSQFIGLVITNLVNTSFHTIAEVVQREFARRGYQLMLSITAGDHVQERSALRTLVDHSAAGVIVVGSDSEATEELRELGTPTVHLARRPRQPASDCVLGDEIAGGRSATEYLRRPLDHLRDTAAIVRALLSGDERGYAGAVYRLAPGVRLRYPLPFQVPPLLLGTWGARGAALAGEIADEIKVGGSANPAVVPLIRDRVAVGTLAAGRPPDAVRVVLGAVTVVSEDGQAARQRARTEVARYLAVVADLDPTTELPDGFAGRIRGLVAAGRDSAAGALIPDEVLDRFAFSGTPSHVAGLARRVLEAGAGRVDFGAPHGRTDADGVALLGTAVLPRLR